MIVPVLIVYFKLGETFLAEFFFIGVERRELFLSVRTLLIVAFVNGGFFAFFPSKKRFETIRTEVLIGLAEADMQPENTAADFAF